MDSEMMNAGILTEVYKFVPGYNTFLVSNLGNVKHINGTPKALRDHPQGYLQVYLREEGKVGKTHLVHRLVAEAFIPNPEGYKYVDHRDHNKKNNIRTNLTWCTNKDNQGNRLKQASPTTSRFKGVYWNKSSCKWHSRIMIKRKYKHLGYFTDEIEAAKKYDEYAKIVFKQFALLNFPEEV